MKENPIVDLRICLTQSTTHVLTSARSTKEMRVFEEHGCQEFLPRQLKWMVVLAFLQGEEQAQMSDLVFSLGFLFICHSKSEFALAMLVLRIFCLLSTTFSRPYQRKGVSLPTIGFSSEWCLCCWIISTYVEHRDTHMKYATELP
jgi:hypothetical protein